MKNKMIFALVCMLGGLLIYANAQQGEQPVALKEAMKLDEQGRHDEAVEAIKRIINQTPHSESMQAHMSLALVYFRKGRYDEALSEFSKTLEIQDSNTMALYFSGMIYEKKALGAADPAMAKEMKAKALKSWQGYISAAESSETRSESHKKSIIIPFEESVERAKKHVEMLKAGLSDEKN